MSNLPLLKGEQRSSVCVWMSKTNRKGTQNSRVVNKEHPNHTANQTVFSHVRALERTVISRAPPSSGQEPRGPAAPNRSRGLTHWVRRRPRRGGGFRGPFIFPVARQTRAEQLPGGPAARGPQAWGGGSFGGPRPPASGRLSGAPAGGEAGIGHKPRLKAQLSTPRIPRHLPRQKPPLDKMTSEGTRRKARRREGAAPQRRSREGAETSATQLRAAPAPLRSTRAQAAAGPPEAA